VAARYFKNIDEDGRSANALRDEIISELSGAISADDAMSRYDRWCEDARNRGRIAPTPVNDFAADERVGTLRYRDSFAARTAKALRSDPELRGVDESDIQEVINWLFGEPCTIEPNVARFLYDTILADRLMDASLWWLYRMTPRTDDPLADADLECLPWRLGLPRARTGSKYVGLSVDPDLLASPRLATFIDVSWDSHEFWRPTGKTEPRADKPVACSSEGFDEFVSGAPAFRSATFPAKVFMAR
jgi:hypothetical protein